MSIKDELWLVNEESEIKGRGQRKRNLTQAMKEHIDQCEADSGKENQAPNSKAKAKAAKEDSKMRKEKHDNQKNSKAKN